MKLTHASIAVASLAGLALATSIAGELSWGPAAEVTLRRELVTKQILVTESMTFTEGEETTVSQRIFDLSTTTTLRTSDQLKQVAEGRPAVLRRFYDEARVDARSEVSGGRQRTRGLDIVGESPFEGLSVVFTWVPEDGEYGLHYDGREGREELLPGLSEDLGARALLPEGEVAEGDSWELSPAVLADLFAPGGDLGYDFEGAKDPLVARSMVQGVGANPFRFLHGESEGALGVRWDRTEEVEGRRLAVLVLEFDVSFQGDITALVNEMRAVNEVVAGQETTRAVLKVDLEGGGEVRWSLDDHCLYDTEGLRAEERLVFDKLMSAQSGDGPRKLGQKLVMTGSISQSSSVVVER